MRVSTSRPAAIVLAAALLALAVATVVVISELSQEEETGGVLGVSGPDGFTVDYPEGWVPLSETELAAFDSPPVAGLQRSDDTGTVTIRRSGELRQDYDRLARNLKKDLSRQVPDFALRRTGTVETEAGQGYLFSYVREEVGSVHSLVFVPAEQGSYVLDTVTQPGGDDAGAQIGEIVTSFELAS